MSGTTPRGGAVSLSGNRVAVLSNTWRSAAPLVAAIAGEPGFTGIRIAPTLDAVAVQVERFRPSIIILHEELLSELLTAAESPWQAIPHDVKILVIATRRDSDVKSFIERGCAGVLPPDASLALALQAVKAIARGEIWASRRVLAELLRGLLNADQKAKLTRREDEIFTLVVQGKKNHEIADELFISRETVRWHLRRIYSKLGLHGRPETGRALPAEPDLTK